VILLGNHGTAAKTRDLLLPEDVQRPTTVCFLLISNFSMLSVTAAIEPLRVANRLSGKSYYRWRFISHDGKPVVASNDISVQVDASLADPPPADYLFVCAGLDTDPPYRARLNTALHSYRRQGTRLGSISAGTFILARAGLLDDVSCTVHWEFRPALEQEFPFLDCSSQLYVIDKNIYTVSGGLAGLDLMLHLISLDHSPALSRAIANQFQMDRVRSSASEQRPGALALLDAMPAILQKAVGLMFLNVEDPLSTRELSERVGVSIRNLERLFLKHLGQPPARFYMKLRLEKARDLLLHSNLSVLEIAISTGFTSSSYFASCYIKHYGERPSRHRTE
jgi:transcriptional regulator GlxA family with amidase domain